MKTHHTANLHHGASLILVMFTVMVCAFLLSVVFALTTNNARLTRRTVDRSVAIAFGDAVLESLFDQWRNAMITAPNAPDRAGGLTTGSVGSLAAPNPSQLPRPAGITLLSSNIWAADPMMTKLVGSSDRPLPENGTNSTARVRLYYIAEAVVKYPGVPPYDQVTVQRVFVRAGRNIFDNFFFGIAPETEFHPGAPMYVDGTVYAGGNLYTAHDYLVFLNDVSFLGQHQLDYRSNDPRHGTDPTIDNNGLADNWDANNPPRVGVDQKLLDTPRTSLDPNFLDDPIANDADSNGNQNDNGYHEIIEEAAVGPDPLQVDPTTNERFSANADYRIYVDAGNNVTIYKGLANVPLSTSSPDYVAIKGALTTDRAIKDIRDGDNVRVTVVDVAKIKTAYDTNKISDNVNSDGLLLYIKDGSYGTPVPTQVVDSTTSASTAVTSSRSRGVKLINGAVVPSKGSTGFTVASPNTVYIQGDFNSGKTSTQQPPSNTATSYTPPNDAPLPVVSGYNRAPAAVLGDAVNILSNGWNDAKSLLGVSSRTASNTTVNCALVAGNVPTTSSSYSGGVENFVRFHENWSGRYLTIYGALAQLFASQQATRPWVNADYSPPNRRWYYDTLLQDTNPPGFHVARVYGRGQWSLK
jgi:Tfp pilus assembly protein PilX